MIAFTYKGEEFFADENFINSYKNVKKILEIQKNPESGKRLEGMVELFEKIFNGKDEEYAERVGGDMASMNELFIAASQAIQDKANAEISKKIKN